MMNEETVKSIDELLNSNVGDKGRLEHIKNFIQQGKTLYNSDKKYLDSLLDQEPKSIESKSEKTFSSNSKISQSPVQHNNSPSNKPYKPVKTPRIDNTPYGITYHVSGRNEVKIHHNSCRFYQNASQSGSTKWIFRNGYQNSKSDAASIANQHSTYYKNAQCCLNGIIGRSLSTALFMSLFPFFGLLGNLIIRDYYPTLGRGMKYWGLVYGIASIILYGVNNIIN